MNDYLKLNKDRWNRVNNDYTQPLTHEELEEARNNPISVALTVGKTGKLCSSLGDDGRKKQLFEPFFILLIVSLFFGLSFPCPIDEHDFLLFTISFTRSSKILEECIFGM